MNPRTRLLRVASFLALAAAGRAQMQSLDPFAASMAGMSGPNMIYGAVPPNTTPTTTNFPSVPAESNLAIPALGQKSSFIDVSGMSGYLWDVDVHVNLTHADSGELDVYLVAPTGRIVTLTTDNANGVGNAYTNTSFDDSASETVLAHAFSSSQTFTLVPEGALGGLIGIDPNPGLWELRVADDSIGASGTIVSWSLDVTTLSPVPAPIDYTAADSQPFSLSIPDNNSNGRNVFAILIDAAIQLEKVRVRVQIAHPRPSDLTLTLTSPMGTTIPLSTKRGGSTLNAFGNVEFRDDAVFGGGDAPVSDFDFALNGAPAQLVPEGAMSAFAGEDASGTWTVHVVDSVVGMTGTILGVSVSADVWDLGGSATGYCTSGTSSNGCVPTLMAGGTALTATEIEGQKMGLFFYGVSGPRYAPWGLGSTSTLCVRPPLQRLPAMNSGGFLGTCTGTYLFDCATALAAHGVATGTTCYVQCWYRDPPAPKTTNLTNAVVVIAP